MKVAFIGHREINDNTLGERLELTIINLIKEGADIFIFGSKSKFDSLSYDIVTNLKKIYPQIKRIYMRSDYEEIEGRYEKYLYTLYEETYYPSRVRGAGAVSYIQRNRAMIDGSDVLVTYYDVNYFREKSGNGRKSGTYLAVKYAKSKNKPVINLF